MKENEEKPDQVVWTKEKGYYQKGLTYGSNVSAPAINLENINGWKQSNVDLTQEEIAARVQEYERLVHEVQLNELVYSSKYSFTPVMGQVYHLYSKADESLFLSLISPDTWKQQYIGSFKLDTDHKWIKVDFLPR